MICIKIISHNKLIASMHHPSPYNRSIFASARLPCPAPAPQSSAAWDWAWGIKYRDPTPHSPSSQPRTRRLAGVPGAPCAGESRQSTARTFYRSTPQSGQRSHRETLVGSDAWGKAKSGPLKRGSGDRTVDFYWVHMIHERYPHHSGTLDDQHRLCGHRLCRSSILLAR